MSFTVTCPDCFTVYAFSNNLSNSRLPCARCSRPLELSELVKASPRYKNLTKPKQAAPTERQLEYARGLGIDIPANIDRNGLSDLISEAVEQENGFIQEYVWELRDQSTAAHQAVYERARQEIKSEPGGAQLDDLSISKIVEQLHEHRHISVVIISCPANAELEDGTSVEISISSRSCGHSCC